MIVLHLLLFQGLALLEQTLLASYMSPVNIVIYNRPCIWCGIGINAAALAQDPVLGGALACAEQRLLLRLDNNLLPDFYQYLPK